LIAVTSYDTKAADKVQPVKKINRVSIHPSLKNSPKLTSTEKKSPDTGAKQTIVRTDILADLESVKATPQEDLPNFGPATNK
jgi:hypothetical protein